MKRCPGERWEGGKGRVKVRGCYLLTVTCHPPEPELTTLQPPYEAHISRPPSRITCVFYSLPRLPTCASLQGHGGLPGGGPPLLSQYPAPGPSWLTPMVQETW